MSENKKAIDMTPEELEQWIKFLPAPEDDSSYFYFSDPDPYFKFERKPDEQRSSRWFNHDGHLTVRNHCAAALPKITVTLHSGQTTYRFGGSYDGSRSLSGKLLDRMAKDIEKEIENEYRVEQNSDLLNPRKRIIFGGEIFTNGCYNERKQSCYGRLPA